jgi:hypothetical protein
MCLYLGGDLSVCLYMCMCLSMGGGHWQEPTAVSCMHSSCRGLLFFKHIFRSTGWTRGRLSCGACNTTQTTSSFFDVVSF